jgi:hypothetical protein
MEKFLRDDRWATHKRVFPNIYNQEIRNEWAESWANGKS